VVAGAHPVVIGGGIVGLVVGVGRGVVQLAGLGVLAGGLGVQGGGGLTVESLEHNESEETAGSWTWSRDPHFPQHSNLLDCWMVAVVTVIHVSRGWQIPSIHATSITGYRQWLVQVITNDCEKVFKVPCHRCGTNQLHSQVKKVQCGDKQRCDEARE